jgi:hypothetical protein
MNAAVALMLAGLFTSGASGVPPSDPPESGPSTEPPCPEAGGTAHLAV